MAIISPVICDCHSDQWAKCEAPGDKELAGHYAHHRITFNTELSGEFSRKTRALLLPLNCLCERFQMWSVSVWGSWRWSPCQIRSWQVTEQCGLKPVHVAKWGIYIGHSHYNVNFSPKYSLLHGCHMSIMASEITGNSTVCSTVCQKIYHQSSTLPALLWEESTSHWWIPLTKGQ